MRAYIGHIWGIHGPHGSSNGACMRAYIAIYGGSNGACMRAYMAIYGGSNGACIRACMGHTGAAMGHACAHTWATREQQWGMYARIHGHIWGQQWGMRARIDGPYMGQPYRESREGIPCYSLPFPAPGKGITEPSFPSLPFPGSLPWPGKGRDSLPCSAA